MVTQLKLWLPIPGRALDQGWTGLGATWVSGKCPWPWFVIKRKSGGKAWRIVVTGGWLIWPKLTSWAGLSLTVLPLLDSWTWQKCWSKNLDQHRGAKSLCPYESTFGDGSFAAYNSHWRSRCLSKSQKKNRDNGNAALQLWRCWEQWENNTVWGNSAGCTLFGSLFLPYYFILWEENSRLNPCAGDSLGLESLEGFTTSKGVSGWRHQCSASSTWSSREGFMSWEWRIWRDYWQSLCRNKFQILVLVLQLFRQTFSWRTSRITQPSAPPGFLLSRPQELLLKPGGTKPSFFFPIFCLEKEKPRSDWSPPFGHPLSWNERGLGWDTQAVSSFQWNPTFEAPRRDPLSQHTHFVTFLAPKNGWKVCYWRGRCGSTWWCFTQTQWCHVS